MQQRFPAPDDYTETHDSDGYETGDYDHPAAAPRLTPDEIAEQSALEVFPGAEKALDSDQWWLQSADDQPPDGSTSEPSPEPIDLQQHQHGPSEDTEQVAPPEGDTPPQANDRPDEPTAALAHEPPVAATNVVAPETTEIAAESPVPPAVPTQFSDLLSTSRPAVTAASDIPESALNLPLLSGRAQRESVGASQRAAILAAAGAPIDLDGAGELPADQGTNFQPAVAPPGRTTPPTARPAKPRRSFTRKLSLVLIVGALSILLLSGGAFASGQGAEVERIAASLAPDVLENWISDRVSSFGGASTAPLDDESIAAPTRPDDQSLSGQIARTGGIGVPIRSTCIPEARTPRTIPEGSSITVIARGVGDCSGWSVVRAGATVSWVESAFLEPTP